MFDSILVTDVEEGTIEFGSSLICVLVALALGVIISLAYVILLKKKGCSPNMALTMCILPAIVAIVILMVGSNVARAFSIAGVFALIRFRSVPGDAKDIAFVFLAAACGLSAGMGYLTFALVFTIILCLAFVAFGQLTNKYLRDSSKELKILIPEDMNYQDAFDDLLKKYTNSSELVRVKTTNMGTMFELTYKIVTTPNYNSKEFLDAIRCRNGNLNVSITQGEMAKSQQL